MKLGNEQRELDGWRREGLAHCKIERKALDGRANISLESHLSGGVGEGIRFCLSKRFVEFEERRIGS
jgi:hypothetical protein